MMTPRRPLLAAAFLAASTLAHAQVPTSALGRDDAGRSAILESLRDGNRALAECNREAFRKSRTPSVVTTTATGAFAAAPTMVDCKPGEPDVLDNLHVTTYGDAALVEGLQSVRRDDGELSAPRRFLALFVNDAGLWKMAAYHDTLIDVSQASRGYALFVEHAWTSTPAVVATSGTNAVIASDVDNLDPDPEQDVLDSDAELNEAINAADKQAYRRVVADDMSCVGVDGVARKLAQCLQLVTGPSPAREVHDVRANVYGKAAVTTAWVRNEDRSLVRYTRVWVKRNGAWRVVATQTSRMASLPLR
jgi:hypothetical protein